MPALPSGIWREWSVPPGPTLAILALAALYLRGWWGCRSRRLEVPSWRAFCFLCGLATLWIALASPIDVLDDDLLAAHMIQHFMLMSVAPPLIMLGAPAVPLLRSLRGPIIRCVIGPLLRASCFRKFTRVLANPLTAWLAMNLVYLGWHIPAAFELTFRSESIHNFEHLCFFMSSLAFWWHVVAPWPYHPRWPRAAIIPYLLTADIVNTILSALLTFSGRVFYPSYAAAERITMLTPLQDQIAAGSEMWVLNSFVFLVPAFMITLQILKPRGLRTAAAPALAHSPR